MGAYSFLDVQASITGPGGAFALGHGAGAAEEGIAVTMSEDKNTMTVGASGDVMHSLHGGRSGLVTVSLLKTSPTNQRLSQMYAIQTSSSAAHGLNTISIKNNVSGDTIICTEVAFKKMTDVAYAKVGDKMVWSFDAGRIIHRLGAGIAANLSGQPIA